MAGLQIIDPRQDMTAKEYAFCEGILEGKAPEVLADEIGFKRDQARRFMKSSRMLAAVSAIGLTRMHGIYAPHALSIMSGAMNGYLTYVNSEGEKSQVMLKPEAVLGAADKVLKLAGFYDRAAQGDPSEGKDIGDMDAEQLRDFVSQAESKLATMAQPVPNTQGNAPNDVQQVQDAYEIPNDYNPLD